MDALSPPASISMGRRGSAPHLLGGLRATRTLCWAVAKLVRHQALDLAFRRFESFPPSHFAQLQPLNDFSKLDGRPYRNA